MLRKKRNILNLSHTIHGGGGYIRCLKNVRTIGTISSFLLLVLTLVSVCPIVDQTDNAEAEAIESNTAISIATGRSLASVDITPTSSDGNFEHTDNTSNVAFTVTTDNLTGYSLLLSGNDATGALTNAAYSDTLASISSAINETTFETGSGYTNKWGIKPDTVNSAPNTDYLPAPTTSSSIVINETNTKNTTPDSFKIDLGAKVDYIKPAGTYTNTFILQATSNQVLYEINYLDTTGDASVIGIPDSDPGTSVTNISNYKLSTATPTRTGYTFAGWCDGAVTHVASGNSSCNPDATTGAPGTVYNAGDNYSFSAPSSISASVANLRAMWNVNIYRITKRFKLQNADGTYPSTWDTTDGYVDIPFNTTTTYTKTATTSHQQATITSPAATGNANLDLEVPRKTHKITFTFSTGAASVKVCKTSGNCSGTNLVGTATSSSTAVSGLLYGAAYYLYPTFTTTSSSNNYSGTYYFKNWAAGSGSVGTLSSTSTSNPTFTIGNGDGKVTITGQPTTFNDAYGTTGTKYMSGMTTTICRSIVNGQTSTLTDNRGTTRSYTVAKINGKCWMTQNLNLAGGTALTSSNSNVSSNYTLPATETISSGTKLANASAFLNNATAYVFNSGSTTCSSSSPCYTYYSYVAATAGANPSSAAASTSICPKGWKLPTQAEFNDLKSSYSSGNALAAAPFKGVYAGYYNNDSFYNGGSLGRYWSSTPSSSSAAYSLNFSSSNAYTEAGDKRAGLSVRCINS